MQLEKAIPLAAYVYECLAPHCRRMAIAGSVRRHRPNVNDIEVVCVPNMVPAIPLLDGTFQNVRDIAFCNTVRALGHVHRGSPEGKYCRVILSSHDLTANTASDDCILPRYRNEQFGQMCVDIFTATSYNFGLILAIRTGSAAYVHQVLARGLVRNGYTLRFGSLHRSVTRDGMGNVCKSHALPTQNEDMVFAMAGVPYAVPQDREVPAHLVECDTCGKAPCVCNILDVTSQQSNEGE